MSTPFIGIVSLFFIEIVEMRSKAIKPIKYLAGLGGIFGGIGAIFWAYTDLFLLHHLFLVGLSLLFLCALFLVYGLIPGKEVKESEYYRDLPKIAGFNLLHLSAVIVILGMIVFAIFGAVAAIIMLELHEPFFLVEYEFVFNRALPKELFQELASFHMRLMNALLLTGVLILTFRYTAVKGRLAKIGLWFILIGTLAMTAGYFLMFIGPAANAVLMPARALILFTGVIIAFDGWIKVSKEELGSRYESASFGSKIIALFKNPLRMSMFITFFLAGIIVVIPGMIIVANLEAYRNLVINYTVERNFATGHPHVLITLGAIVVFSIIIHNMIPKNRLRKLIGWTLFAGLFVVFPASAFFFLRSPSDVATETALTHIIFSGFFILLFDIFLLLVLFIYQLIFKRKKLSDDIIPFVIDE